MSSIDERIVDMQFKSKGLVDGVSLAISALTNLKSHLNFKGAEDSLNNLDAAGKRFSLAGMLNGVSGASQKFSALGVLGVAALGTVAAKAVSAGISLVKAFTIDPIKAGLDVYETKINAIQTILANTQSEGTNLKQVTAALDQLNVYANQTVYNFGEMAQNIGTFTAAGVDLKTSVASIKGIANLAALSGSSAQQASTAMYQLSQAIAAGSVKLQDWNSVVNAGLGGKVFQNALEQTAKATGVNIDAIIKKAGSFRNSLQSGWLTSKILTQTLETFTGDLTNQQLKSLGYSQKQIVAIQKQAQTAKNAATQIKTLTQLHQALAEEVATAWSRVWEALIGNIGVATGTLTAAHNTLENLFTNPIKSLGNLLEEWNMLGGRDLAIQTMTEALQTLESILKPIGQAFRDVFPPVTAQDLIHMTIALQNFVEHLKISKSTADNIRKTFEGLFSVVKIGIDLILDIGKGIVSMFSGAGKAGSGIVSLTGSVGGFISKARNALESGTGLAKFFTDLGKVIGAPIKLLGLMVGALGSLGSAAKKAWAYVEPFATRVGQAFKGLGSAIAQGIASGNFSNVLNTLNQGLFGLILLQVKKFIAGLTKTSEEKGGFFKGLKDQINEVFEGLTGTLKSMQDNLKSGTLLKIAAAVGILTASVVALSFINPQKLTQALAAITLMFTELLAGMAIVSKISGSAGIVKMPIIAFSLNLLATSILILAGAVAILSAFSWEHLGKGIAAIAALLLELVVATKLMSSNSKGLIASSTAMIIMATALNILALAVRQLGALDFSTLAKGIGSIAALLLVVTGFQRFAGGGQLISSAASLLILGAALNVVAVAVQTLGQIPMGELAKGILGVAAALLVIAGAMTIMPPNLISTAAGVLIVSAALVVLSQALTAMGALSWTAVAISLIELAGSLGIISAAMNLMVGALPGAAAMIVMAGALAILTPVLIALGNLSWGQLLTALGALAGVFLILGVAGLVLTPIVPVIIGLGVAIGLIGIGIGAAGAGVLAFAAGLTALGAASAAAGVGIAAFVSSILGLVPLALREFGLGIVQLSAVIGQNAPAIIGAFVKLASSLLGAVIVLSPKIGQAVQAMLSLFLNLINRNAGPIINTMVSLLLRLLGAISAKTPSFVNAGVGIIVGVLNGIARNAGRMGQAGGNAAIAFINAIGTQAGRIAAAGVNMVINLVNNVANTIRNNSGRMNAAGRNLASAIIGGMVAGISGGIAGVGQAALNVAKSALNAAKNFLGINSPSKEFQYVGEGTGEGMIVGINNFIKPVANAAKGMGSAALDSMRESLTGINDLVSSNIDLQPKITPVVDLSQATAGLGGLNDLTKSQLIAATVSASKASSISAANAAAAAQAGLLEGGAGTSLTFVQNNTSPKALSTADIYRQTKNQLSVVKGGLPTSANKS